MAGFEYDSSVYDAYRWRAQAEGIGSENMAEIRIEDLNSETVGVIADLSNWTPSDEEVDDDSYRKELEEELNKIQDFIKRHPLPSEEFWEDVINRFRDNSGLNLMTIYSLVRFDIINEMYENLIDEDIIEE